MKNSDRTNLIEALAELAERYPHWRFGQLVANLATWADVNVWDVEDAELLEQIQIQLDQLASRTQVDA